MLRRQLLGMMLATAALGGAGLPAAPAQAAGSDAELVMFDDTGCPYCRRWRREVGPAYDNSPEGRRAPLRTVQLRGALPAGITLAAPVRATPTFVLVQDGREVGRITGYPGADFFWGMLTDLMRKLERRAHPI